MTKLAILTVTYNARVFIADFIDSVFAANLQDLDVQLYVIDNGSSDGTQALVASQYPQVNLIENDENNYTRALNVGIAQSSGDYVVIVNNDATVEAQWLQGLVSVIESSEKIAAVQSKIFFTGGRKLNSVGVEEIEHFYFRDIGFEEPDSARYSKPEQRDYVTGGSVMFRRAALEDIGPWDEEFVMFMEDVEYSARARAAGWELWYSPQSIIYHQYHGSASQELCEYFCTRNRFLFVARHFPMELAATIPTSHFYKKGEFDLLYRSLLHAVRKLCETQEADTVREVLEHLKVALPKYLGEVSAHNFFSHMQVMLGLRKPRVGIYDHAGHFAGGGQRYVAEMAALMQDRYDITYIFNNDVELSSYKEWFDLDLSRCDMKIIRIPFFDERQRYTADEAMVVDEVDNPFDVISQETLNYDIFINANMLGKVNPLSPVSIFICHFPDQEKARFFQVDKYDYLVINGDYTGEWVGKRWDLEPTHKLYPPVNMFNPQSSPEKKEKIILSVSRFELGGSKKQLELIQAWKDLCAENPEEAKGWKLVMMGGSTPENTYLDAVNDAVAAADCPIEIKPNASIAEIKDHYKRASIFWHACGLDETKPQLVEHFGMTTVESMQNCCVPIVIDGGGQREIVEHGKSGYRFSTLEQLRVYSLIVMEDPKRCQKMAKAALDRSQLFGMEVFEQTLNALLEEVDNDFCGRDVLPGPMANDSVSA